MGKTQKRQWVAGFILFLAATSCGTGNLLPTSRTMEGRAVEGTFTVILYGGQNANDFETVAILDRQGDVYQFETFGGRYSATVFEGMNTKEALDKAKRFVGQHTAFRAAETRVIKGPAGALLGYEIRPIFSSTVAGGRELLDTRYVLQPDNIIMVYVYLNRGLDRMFYNDSSSR